MKDKTGSVVLKECARLKTIMFLFLIYNNSEHKKAKGVSRSVVLTISHNKYKDVLLNNKSLRHSMNRVQSKGHRIGTYEINKISLSCFNDKRYIQNNGYHRLDYGY